LPTIPHPHGVLEKAVSLSSIRCSAEKVGGASRRLACLLITGDMARLSKAMISFIVPGLQREPNFRYPSRDSRGRFWRSVAYEIMLLMMRQRRDAGDRVAAGGEGDPQSIDANRSLPE